MLNTGAFGSASILKVITNCIVTANIVSCTEALTFARASGMNLDFAYEAMKIFSGTSLVNATESQDIINGSRDISFTMDLFAKDIGLFQEVVDRAEVPLELNPLLISIFTNDSEIWAARIFSQYYSPPRRCEGIVHFSAWVSIPNERRGYQRNRV